MVEESTPRIVDRTERNAATSFRDNASGPPVEQPAVTGRPNDTPVKEPEEAPLGGNSTMASRAKARQKASSKAVASAENKAVKGSRKK